MSCFVTDSRLSLVQSNPKASSTIVSISFGVPTQASACNTQTAATNSAPKPRLCRKDRTPKRLQGYDIALEVTMPNTAAKRLYDLLDSLVALRLEFATGAEGDEALSPLGRSKVLAVRTVLDTAIQGTKQIIGAIERPKPPPA